METCKSCYTEVSQNFCPNCGRPANLRRIDGTYVFQEIRNVLNFEKGFLFTIRELAIHPGRSIKAFIKEERNRLVKPIVFLIVTSFIYSALNAVFLFEEAYTQFADQAESATQSIFKWVQGNYGYANMVMALFIGWWIKLFFRKYSYNIFEILILLCFVMGFGMLIYAIFGLIQVVMHTNLMQIGSIAGFVYTTFAIGQFFNPKKAGSYVKAFFAYLMGFITFSVAAVLLGVLIDFMLKQ